MINDKRNTVTRPYEQDGTRVISLRVAPETLKALRFIAAARDTTVCAMLRGECARLVSGKGGKHCEI